MVGERTLGGRAFALARTDGKRLRFNRIGQNRHKNEREGRFSAQRKQTEAVRKRDLRDADRINADVGTGKGVVALGHAEKIGGKRKIALPSAGQTDLQ